jgi:L-amino acid N-acyltransferase YncA
MRTELMLHIPPCDESESMHIRRATAGDAERIAEIYNWYILNAINTFETEVVSPQEMTKRIQEKLLKHDWLVGEVNQEVIGYAYYGPFRPRAAYHHTVESTIYLAQNSTGLGFGRTLYVQLLESLRSRGFREVVGVIALPNPRSIALHKAIGFTQVGMLKRVGYKFERYIDVGFWQLSVA